MGNRVGLTMVISAEVEGNQTWDLYIRPASLHYIQWHVILGTVILF